MTFENEIFDGCIIPDELLDQIAGGLSEEVESTLWKAMVALKANGTSLDRTLEIFAKTEDPTLREESLAYIAANWDLV